LVIVYYLNREFAIVGGFWVPPFAGKDGTLFPKSAAVSGKGTKPCIILIRSPGPPILKKARSPFSLIN
jgi:hypothetical protein